MSRVLICVLAACDATDPIERVSLASECGIVDRDTMEARIDARSLCARATLLANPVAPDGTESLIDPGSFNVAVVATLSAGDGTSYFLAVGVGSQTRRVHAEPAEATVRPSRVIGPDKRRSFPAGDAIANLSERRLLDLDARIPHEWLTAKHGSVTFDHYDLRTGISRGSFELEFEATRSMVETRRPIHVVGTFETATPPTFD